MSEPSTIVIFRADRKDGDVTAVFPTLPADSSWTMTCYAHIGQHSGCCREWYCDTRPARPDEYADLAAELRQIGYVLDIRQRITREMDDERRREWRAVA